MQPAWFPAIQWHICISKMKHGKKECFMKTHWKKPDRTFVAARSHRYFDFKKTDGTVVASSKRGRAEITKKNGKLEYNPSANDPFGFPKNLDSKNDYFDATLIQTIPTRFCKLGRSCNPKGRDLIVTAAIGHDLRDRFEIPEHFSSHGSLHHEHMSVRFSAIEKLILRKQKEQWIFFQLCSKWWVWIFPTSTSTANHLSDVWRGRRSHGHWCIANYLSSTILFWSTMRVIMLRLASRLSVKPVKPVTPL